jgi:hypothetical protein
VCVAENVKRRQFLGAGLAAGLAATAVGSTTPALALGGERPSGGGPGSSGVRFTWFGTNGRQIEF